jgi:hypothetical protein
MDTTTTATEDIILDEEVRAHLRHYLTQEIYWMGPRMNVRWQRRMLALLDRTPHMAVIDGDLLEAVDQYGTTHPDM